MKPFVLAALLLTGGSVAAQEATQADVCKSIGDLAESIMKLRQEEIPMSELLAVLAKAEDTAGMAEVARSVVMAAYEQSAMRTPENKANQLAQFRNDVELECFKSVQE